MRDQVDRADVAEVWKALVPGGGGVERLEGYGRRTEDSRVDWLVEGVVLCKENVVRRRAENK